MTYTPTTDEVEHRYAYDELYSMDCEADHRAFRRWLAAHDVEVRAQALRGAASAPIPRAALNTRNGLRQWLRARADRIERGEVRAGYLAAHAREVREVALAPIREALAGHPRCDIHPDGDPITCGWKRAVASVQAALDKEGR